ncbi:MAG: hypothetical protein VKJ02_09000 [Snowella sp.]|nr:hypothetical protein [Snowella sp.]
MDSQARWIMVSEVTYRVHLEIVEKQCLKAEEAWENSLEILSEVQIA